MQINDIAAYFKKVMALASMITRKQSIMRDHKIGRGVRDWHKPTGRSYHVMRSMPYHFTIRATRQMARAVSRAEQKHFHHGLFLKRRHEAR